MGDMRCDQAGTGRRVSSCRSGSPAKHRGGSDRRSGLGRHGSSRPGRRCADTPHRCPGTTRRHLPGGLHHGAAVQSIPGQPAHRTLAAAVRNRRHSRHSPAPRGSHPRRAAGAAPVSGLYVQLASGAEPALPELAYVRTASGDEEEQTRRPNQAVACRVCGVAHYSALRHEPSQMLCRKQMVAAGFSAEFFGGNFVCTGG